MKILHTEWSNGWGGQEIRIITEMIAMREAGYELFLACREDAKIKEKAIEKGFKVFIFPFRGNTDIGTLFGLMRLIRKEKIDIVNTHSGKDTWVGGIAAKLTGAKFIRTRHLSNPINSSYFNFINQLADFIMTTGESIREEMIKKNRISPEKIVSVPTGIDSNRFNPEMVDRDAARKRYGLEEDEVAIGIIAVLREFKNHEVFLAVAKEVTVLFPRTKFFIAGDGPRRMLIERLIEEYGLQDNIYMLGHIDDPEILLGALDVFILTSHSKEGVPQSVNQALMMNKCVIATDVGSTRDLYHDHNFYLVPPNDVQIIVDIVRELIEDREKMEQCKARAREYAVMYFSLKGMQQKIGDIYNRLVENRNKKEIW